MRERIISADSHFEIRFDRVLECLPAKHRDAAVALRAGLIAKEMMATAKPSKLPAMRNRPGRTAEAQPLVEAQGQPYPAEGRPGISDPSARLADMDIDQVDAEVLYLSLEYGEPEIFYLLADSACSAAFHALTTVAIEVASADPDRLVPVYPVPLHDLDVSIKEVHRIANEGGRAVMLPAHPTDWSLAPYWDDVYDQLFSTLEDLGLAISQHVSFWRSRQIALWDPTPAKAITRSLPPIFTSEVLGGWVVTGIFDRHPGLEVVLVETGLSWIPYYLQRLDAMPGRQGFASQGMTLPRPPSEYWYSNMAATFQEDVVGMKLLDELGVDNVMWAADYPHPACTWPESQNVIREHFDSLSPDVMRKIVSGNAARIYNL